MCDGDWEHTYGITVSTSDNPGWIVDIDIEGTPLEGAPFAQVSQGAGDDRNFLHCIVRDGQFQGRGAGTIGGIDIILQIFLDWAASKPR